MRLLVVILFLTPILVHLFQATDETACKKPHQAGSRCDAYAAFEDSSKTAIVQDEECLRIGLMGISGVSSKYDLDDAHY
jgi:hypothetical protein